MWVIIFIMLYDAYPTTAMDESTSKITDIAVTQQRLIVSDDSKADDFPISLDELRVIGHINSGGGAFILSDHLGRNFILKYDWDVDHYKEEILADALYKALGVRVPKFAVYTSPPKDPQIADLFPETGLFRLTEKIEGPTLYELNDNQIIVNKGKLEPFLSSMATNFVADALLSNWDITNLKNIIINLKDNVVVRIDNGGSLRYRATGDKKSESFSWTLDKVSELESLKNIRLNHNGYIIYSSLTAEDIKKQILNILERQDNFFHIFNKVAKVLNINDADTLELKLKARFEDLKQNLNEK